MQYSNYLFNVAETIKKYCLELKFPEDDIRNDFHGIVYDLTNNYYYGHVAFELSQEMTNRNIMFDKRLIKNKTHIDRLTEIVKLPMLTTSYLSSLNKQFVIGIWTSFESSVNIIAESVLNDTEKQELFSIKKDEILKLLRDKNVDAETLEKISKKLLEKHLSQVPLIRNLER